MKRDEYIEKINELLQQTFDMQMIDFIYKLLMRVNEKGKK